MLGSDINERELAYDVFYDFLTCEEIMSTTALFFFLMVLAVSYVGAFIT